MTALARRRAVSPGTDALTRRVLAELGVFADWCTANGVSGVVGEVGWPYDDAPERWNRLGSAWLTEATRLGLDACYFDAAQIQLGYKLAAYQGASAGASLSVAKAQAEIVGPRFRSAGGRRRGIFLLDPATNTPYLGEATSTFSNASPGTYGTDYTYPSATSFAYLAGQGIDTVLLAFRWERLQPTLGGAFDATESTRLQTCVSAAISAGLDVVLQPFAKGSYYLNNAGTGERKEIGSASCTEAHYQNLWGRISDLYKATAGVVAYAIMNEPNIHAPDAWESISQNLVDYLRDTKTDTKQLWVPMSARGQFSAIGHLHPTAWIVDGGDILYEGHHYYDVDQSGGYASTYAAELTAAGLSKIRDTFTRADAASLGTAEIGGAWSSSSVGVSGNKAYPTASVGTWAEGVIDARYPYGTLQATLSTVGGDQQWIERYAFDRSGSLPIVWRVGAAYGGWAVHWTNHAGVTTDVYNSGGSPAPANGDVVQLIFRNGSLVFKVNGTTLYTRTNADVGWGTVYGLAMWQGGTSRYDDFSFTPDYAGG